MTPLVLAAAGVVALIAAGLTLRSFGTRYRVGRLLATTPKVTVGEAVEMARAGQRAYVRVDGRIDTAEDFEGPDHQPLVLRRVRLEVRDGRRWRPFEDDRQVVPFTVNEGLDTIAIDTDALDAGLVVVPRESIGTAADLADRVPPGTTAETRSAPGSTSCRPSSMPSSSATRSRRTPACRPLPEMRHRPARPWPG